MGVGSYKNKKLRKKKIKILYDEWYKRQTVKFQTDMQRFASFRVNSFSTSSSSNKKTHITYIYVCIQKTIMVHFPLLYKYIHAHTTHFLTREQTRSYLTMFILTNTLFIAFYGSVERSVRTYIYRYTKFYSISPNFYYTSI